MAKQRYAAFLRGVMPTNCKMPELKRAFESAGFTDVVTVLGSGNVVFDAKPADDAALARKAEKAMPKVLGRTFVTIVRPVARLEELLDDDPFTRAKVPASAKRIVTFLVEPISKRSAPKPFVVDGVHVVRVEGGEVLAAYEPRPKGPVFMGVLERTFGKNITTRTWDTVKKVAAR